MRTARIIMPLLIAVLWLAACSGNSLTALPVPPTATQTPLPILQLPRVESPQLTQFHFRDENHGWGMTETQVVRTQDGGLTWYDATPGAGVSFAYAPSVFLDERTAWILIAADDFLTGMLVRTADGGETWSSNAVPFGFASLQFLDANTGFALASIGAGAGSEAVALFKTTDGGENWVRTFVNDPNEAAANDSLPLGGQKYGFTFLDAARGWVGGAAPVDNTIYLYRTRDGGATWSEAGLALPAGYESAQTGNYGPQFFSASEGLLVVHLSIPADPGLATLVYRTNDGGETWTPGQVIAGGRPADFFSLHDGVAFGNGNQFNVTRDAGQTWGALVPDQDFSASLASFQFVNPLVGWALTTNEALDPSLYKTTDGGATWSLIVP